MSPRGIWTLLIVLAIGLLLWTLLITAVLIGFLLTDQPVASPAS